MKKRMMSILLIFCLACTTILPINGASASTDGIVMTLETNKIKVKAGEEFIYTINYSASSTVSNFTDPKIRFTLPPGVTYTGKTDSSITTSVYDSAKREVVFTFKNGELPAGSTGQLIVKGKFENYVTPDETSATTKATLDATVNGNLVSLDSNDVTVTSQAAANWRVEIKKNRPAVDALKGSEVEYEILVQDAFPSSTGRLDINSIVVTAKLADGAVLVSANQGGTVGPNNTIIWNLPDGVRSQQQLSVLVNYPASLQDSEVTNCVEAVFTPLGGTSTIITAQITHGFATAPIPVSPGLELETEPTQREISPGQTVNMYLSGLENNSNIALQDVNAEVLTPKSTQAGTSTDLHLQSMKTAKFSGITNYDIYYTTEESPSAGDWILWSNVNASDSLILNTTTLGDVKIVQVRFPTAPINFVQATDFEFNYKVPTDFPAPSAGDERIEAISKLTYNFNGTPKTITDNTIFYVVTNRPLLLAQISSNKTTLNPTETTTYTASVTNTQQSSDKLQNPKIISLLPAGMEYVPNSWTITKPAGLATNPSFTAELQADGSTKLSWFWDPGNPGSLEIGEIVSIDFDAKVKLGIAAGTLTNTLVIESPTYINDTKFSNKKESATSYSIQQTANIQVGSSAALNAELYAKGELDSDWSKYPNTATTTPGGKVLYKLEIQNTGNEPLKDLVIIDTFPRIGDTSILNGSIQRGSQWGPLLASELIVPSYITPLYTTTPGVSMNPTTGVDNGEWTTSLPADRTTVTAVKLVFDSSYVLDPFNKTTIEWGMIAPVGAPTGGEVAWNSFAYKMNKVSGPSILPAEPLKLGVRIIATPTYTVSYNSNGATSGQAPTDSQGYEAGHSVTVAGNTGSLMKPGYTFAGWNTKADGSGTSYTPGASFLMVAANVTLYANWNINYNPGTGGQLPSPKPPEPEKPIPIEPEVPEPQKPIFSDVPLTHWAGEMIEEMVARGVITGFKDGTFKLNDPVSRQHVAVMVSRMVALNPKRAPRSFTDVSPNHRYYKEIMLLQQAGILDASKGAFKPNEPMTRAQMAKVIVLTFGLTPGDKSTFRDVPSTHWGHDYIAALADAGIALGDEGYFKPNAPVSRAQIIAFLYRTLNR